MGLDTELGRGHVRVKGGFRVDFVVFKAVEELFPGYDFSDYVVDMEFEDQSIRAEAVHTVLTSSWESGEFRVSGIYPLDISDSKLTVTVLSAVGVQPRGQRLVNAIGRMIIDFLGVEGDTNRVDASVKLFREMFNDAQVRSNLLDRVEAAVGAFATHMERELKATVELAAAEPEGLRVSIGALHFDPPDNILDDSIEVELPPGYVAELCGVILGEVRWVPNRVREVISKTLEGFTLRVSDRIKGAF